MESHCDPRVLFVCLDHPEFIDIMDSFQGETDEQIEEELDAYVQNALQDKV